MKTLSDSQSLCTSAAPTHLATKTHGMHDAIIKAAFPYYSPLLANLVFLFVLVLCWHNTYTEALLCRLRLPCELKRVINICHFRSVARLLCQES
eukprot:scaffold188119_cov19-Prasinocladus_malaysianus.AAC.1